MRDWGKQDGNSNIVGGGGGNTRGEMCVFYSALICSGGRFLVQPEGKDVAVMLVNQSKCGDCGQKAKAGDNVRISEQVNISLVFVCFVCLVVFFLRASSFKAVIDETSVARGFNV